MPQEPPESHFSRPLYVVVGEPADFFGQRWNEDQAVGEGSGIRRYHFMLPVEFNSLGAVDP